MNIQKGGKHSSVEADNEVADPVLQERESAIMQNDRTINLDDALDDDNDNPVSQTLVSAAENSGAVEIRDTQELEGEDKESKDR